MPSQLLREQGKVSLWDNGEADPSARFTVKWGDGEEADFSRQDHAELKFDEEIQAARFEDE